MYPGPGPDDLRQLPAAIARVTNIRDLFGDNPQMLAEHLHLKLGGELRRMGPLWRFRLHRITAATPADWGPRAALTKWLAAAEAAISTRKAAECP